MTDRPSIEVRRTPYELVFGPERFEAEIFPAIGQEAELRGMTDGGPEAFVMLGLVGNLLRDLRPGDGEADMPAGPPPEAVHQYGALTWHAWRFWRAGCPLYAFSEALVRRLLGDLPSIGGWTFCAPARAGYLQLPANLLWSRVSEEAAAEPVDGFHWTWLGANAELGRATPRLDLLLALGLRTGRAGLSVIEITATPPGDEGHWGDADAREGGPDFANILPGGELQAYHGIVSVAEVLKLVSRCFHWIESRPDTIERVAGATGPGGDAAGLHGSRLPFLAVRSGGEEER